MKTKTLRILMYTLAAAGTIFIMSACTKGCPPKCEPPIKEDCISFDPDNIEVKLVNGTWKIVEGSRWMFDFENKKDEAMKAYQIIKHYGMNQSCFVGRPDASFEYLLVSGNAPAGPFTGEDCIPFNPDTIEVKKINNRWKIVNGSQWIFDFEDKKDEANLTYCIIKKYGFDHTCYVGRPDASFKYLRK